MEKEKNSNKIIYIMIIVLFLLFFFVLIYLNKDKSNTYNKSEKEYDTILIAGNAIFQKTNNYWNKVTKEENIIKLVNWKKYKIYIDYEYFGDYKLVAADGWLAFDDERKSITLPATDSSFFAYKSSDDIDIKKIEVNDNSDFDKTKLLLSAFDINVNYPPEINAIAKVDLNNDGKEDEIYAMNNTFSEIETEPLFSIFIVKRGSKAYRLFRSTEEANEANMCFPTINSVLDIDNDKEYEIIMSCTNSGLDSIKTVLYKYNSEKDDYEIVISD